MNDKVAALEANGKRERQKKIEKQRRKTIDVDEQLRRLVELYIAETIDDIHYASVHERLLGRKTELSYELMNLERGSRQEFQPARRGISFVNLAKKSFDNGDGRIQREILKAVSSNLVLRDKKLLIEAKKPFRIAAKRPSISLWSG